MAKKYWFFITNEDNWEIISKKMTYGFMERQKRIYKTSLLEIWY